MIFISKIRQNEKQVFRLGPRTMSKYVIFSSKSWHHRSKPAFSQLRCAHESSGILLTCRFWYGRSADSKNILGGKFLSQTLPILAHHWNCLERFKTHSFPLTSEMIILKKLALLFQNSEQTGPWRHLWSIRDHTQWEPRLWGPGTRSFLILPMT